MKGDVNGESTTVSNETFSDHFFVALFESVQSSIEHDAGHNQLDTFGSAMLSDELWRAETTFGAVCQTIRGLWKPVGHKSSSYLHFFLANLRVLLGIVHLRILTLLCTLCTTIR